ncbi:MAG: hypothetical protein AB1757_21155 [Acidobacteriota bacterium]
MMKFFLLVSCLFAISFSAVAQNSTASSKPRPPKTDDEEFERIEQETTLPPEMRIRMELERRNNEYRKVVEDAQKLNDLSGDIAKHFQEQKTLSSQDMKNVNAIEKLAKRILSFAGGSEEKDDAHKNLSLEAMVNRLLEVSTKIKDSLTTETRHVISATVIYNSNEAINLTQFIRKMQK